MIKIRQIAVILVYKHVKLEKIDFRISSFYFLIFLINNFRSIEILLEYLN